MIRSLKVCALAGIVLYCSFPAYAQAPASEATEVLRLNPTQAVERAINHNLGLEAARINLDIKRRKSDLVWNQFLPNVAARGTLARAHEASVIQGMSIPSLGIDIPSTTLPNWTALGTLSADLTLSFALVEGIRSIQLDYDAGRLGFENAKLQMEQGVRKMYNSILLLTANAALLDETYRNTQRQAELAEASFRAGLAPRLVWIQAQVAVENLRPAVRDLQNNVRSLKGTFALLLGLPSETEFELEELSLELLPIPSSIEDLLARAASDNPSILELQAAIRTLQSQLKAQRMQSYTPFLRFDWSLNPVFSGDPLKDAWFGDKEWIERGSFSFTLGISLNALLPFTKEGQLLQDTSAALRMQGLALARTMRETELEVFTKINSLQNKLNTVEAQQATVSLAEESYRLTEEAFRAGLQDFQTVQSSALALNQAKLQLLSEQFNFLNDLLDLEYAIGVPFGTLISNEPLNGGRSRVE